VVKKFLTILSLFIMMLCLVGCSYSYSYEELNDGLHSVEIITISDEQEIETLKILTKEESEDCLQALSTMTFYELSPLTSPLTVKGNAFKLNYKDSSLIIGVSGICNYKENDGFSIGWQQGDREEIEELISYFLEEK
jgi:hypothetical protein